MCSTCTPYTVGSGTAPHVTGFAAAVSGLRIAHVAENLIRARLADESAPREMAARVAAMLPRPRDAEKEKRALAADAPLFERIAWQLVRWADAAQRVFEQRMFNPDHTARL